MPQATDSTSDGNEQTRRQLGQVFHSLALSAVATTPRHSAPITLIQLSPSNCKQELGATGSSEPPPPPCYPRGGWPDAAITVAPSCSGTREYETNPIDPLFATNVQENEAKIGAVPQGAIRAGRHALVGRLLRHKNTKQSQSALCLQQMHTETEAKIVVSCPEPPRSQPPELFPRPRRYPYRAS